MSLLVREGDWELDPDGDADRLSDDERDGETVMLSVSLEVDVCDMDGDGDRDADVLVVPDCERVPDSVGVIDVEPVPAPDGVGI